MNDEDGGRYSTQDLSLQEIYEAAKADHDNLPKLREREEGWRLFAELMSDINGDTSAQIPNVRKSFESKAGRVYQQQFNSAILDVTGMASVAKLNQKYAGENIAEVERVWPRIKEIKDDHDLAVDNRNTLASTKDPDTGQDGYSQAMQDTLEEARAEFATSNTTYSDSTVNTIEPPEYKGPKWEGGKPKTSLDDYKHAYYPDGGGVTGGGGSVGSRPTDGGSSPSSSSSPGPVPTGDGPELQTPGGSPPPATGGGPATGGPTTVPGGGGGPVPPTYVSGPGGNPGGGGLKPATPPSSFKPGPGTTPNAKPTPGMGGQRSPGTGRPVGTGGTNGRNAMGKNSLLPNQRQAASGRNPVTGSMRNGSNPARGGGSGQPGQTGRRGSVPGQGGQTGQRGSGGGRTARSGMSARGVGRPNGGFEESVFRDNRRTVPGVVRGAKGSAPELASQQRKAGTAGNSGKVIGARANKSKKSESKPEFRKGSLTGSGVVSGVSKKDTRFTWSRAKPAPSTEPPSGSVVMNRREAAKPLSAAEEKRRKWRERRQRRRELCAGKPTERQPESELFGGYEGRVVPGVIRPVVHPERVDEQDAGARFSTRGWEGRG